MNNKNDYYYSLTFDNANLIANKIAQGQPITFIGGRASGKTTLTLSTLFEIYDRVVELKGLIKTPVAFVMHPETFEKFKPQLLEIRNPINEDFSGKYNGVPLHTSLKNEKGIIKIAWTMQEFFKIINGESYEMD